MLTKNNFALKGAWKGFHLDFLHKTWRYRQAHATLKNEPLVQALRLRAKDRGNIQIVDATGGLGRDAMILAALGFSVTVLERSRAVYELVSDAMNRASQDSIVCEYVNRLSWHHVDAIHYLPILSAKQHIDLIYMDPMFPKRTKTALVKQEMQMLQDMVGGDSDSDALLRVALTCASQRVVVKRPRLSVSLLEKERQPNYCHSHRSTRFDIYLTWKPDTCY